MNDIVERLRDQGKDAFMRHYSLGMFKLCTEAADEIDRLRRETKMIDVRHFVEVYNFCFDGGGIYTPTDRDKAMIEDAINCYIAECEQARAPDFMLEN